MRSNLEFGANKIFAGVDIGGTKTAVVLSCRPPAILDRIEFPTKPEEGPDTILVRIVDSIRTLLSSHQLNVSDLAAIGVSCGSPLDRIRGIIQQPPNLPTWKDVRIKQLLEREFGVQCNLENDANAGALAEHRYGAAQGSQNMVFLTMGTGIGAGLIVNGRLYRGTSDLAGEIGHVRLTSSGPVGQDKAGSVEAWASGAGMAKVARIEVERAQAAGKTTLLTSHLERNGHTLSAREIWQMAQSGDRVAEQIVTRTGERLGDALAVLVDVLNPEYIVVGGLALRMGEKLLGPARSVVEKEALPGAASACQIVPAALGERVGDVAALCVAMDGQRYER